MSRIAQLIARLGDMPVITAEKAVKAKSRDFFWYSPILKEKLDQVTGDVVVAEPGALMGDIDKAAREALGQELRMHPSTRETATIAGFVAGGSGGVGSIRWGMLAEPGNILRLR